MVQRVGPYEVVRELARGGAGVVYVARDPGLDREVALKVIAPGALGGGGAEALERFRREGLAAARLRHPNVVGVHAVGVLPGGHPYLVMDLIEGPSLAARVERDGPLPAAEAARLTAVVARAVEHAHARGVLHRDLRPANVVLDDHGAPYVADFGLARLVNATTRLTATGEVLGSVQHLAPEQARGDAARVGPATDVYGLGALLYELLTGRPPFAGLEGLAALEAVLARAPEPPRALRPELDPALEAIVTRCLEKDPARRFPSAGDVARSLEAWAVGRAGARARRRARVGPGLVASAAVTLVALVVAGRAELARRAVEVAPAPEATGDVVAAERARLAALLAATGRESDGVDVVAAIDSALALIGAPLDRAELLARRALARVERDDHAGATRDVDEARRLAPDAALVPLAAWRVAWHAGLPRDEVARALGELERAATRLRGADLARLHALRGELLRVTDDWPGSEAATEAALRVDPLVPGVRALRVYPRLGRGDAAGALEDALCRALLAPDEPAGWSMLSAVAERVGDRPRVRAALERALELAPERPASWVDSARDRLARDDLTGALSDAARALSLDPAHAGAAAVRDEVRARLDELRDVRDDPAAVVRGLPPREAARRLDAALRVAPGDLDLRAWRAMVHVELNESDLGRAAAQVVLERAPGHAVARVTLARVSAGSGRYQEALAEVTAVLEAERQPEALVLLAALRGVRDRAQAVRALDEALERAPDMPHALASRAGVRLFAGDVEGAIESARRATALAPWLARPWLTLGLARERLGDLDDARLAVDRSLMLEESVEGRLLRARMHLEAGDPAGAFVDASRALARGAEGAGGAGAEEAGRIRQRAAAALGADPERAAALGVAARGSPHDAEAALTRQLASRPDDAEPLAWRALARAQLGRFGGAEADAVAALRLDATNALARAALSAARLAERRVDDAVELASDLVQRRPDLPLAWTALSAALEAKGERAEARRVIDEALRHEPDLPLALVQRAELAFESGEAGAHADAARAARLMPWSARAWTILAATSLTRADFDGASAAADWACVLGDDGKARLTRGITRLRRNLIDEAIADFDVAIRQRPDDPVAGAYLLAALLGAERLEEVVRRGEALLARWGPAQAGRDAPWRARVEEHVAEARRRLGQR